MKPLSEKVIEGITAINSKNILGEWDFFQKEDVVLALEGLKKDIKLHGEKQCWEEHDCLYEILLSVKKRFGEIK